MREELFQTVTRRLEGWGLGLATGKTKKPKVEESFLKSQKQKKQRKERERCGKGSAGLDEHERTADVEISFAPPLSTSRLRNLAACLYQAERGGKGGEQEAK